MNGIICVVNTKIKRINKTHFSYFKPSFELGIYIIIFELSLEAYFILRFLNFPLMDFEKQFVICFLNNFHDLLSFTILKFICTKQGEVCHNKLVG